MAIAAPKSNGLMAMKTATSRAGANAM